MRAFSGDRHCRCRPPVEGNAQTRIFAGGGDYGDICSLESKRSGPLGCQGVVLAEEGIFVW